MDIVDAAHEPPKKRAKVETDAAVPSNHPAPLQAPDTTVQPSTDRAPLDPESRAQHEIAPTDDLPEPPAQAANGTTAPPPAVPLPPPPPPPPTNPPVASTHTVQSDTYCTRELRHIERETTGELQAFYVQNDGEPDSGRYLIGLKNVFAKCLPNMPKTYITRLVFDRRHRSVVIVRNGVKVIGGITYRPFHERRFAEIAFCAVAQTLQVAGFGTRLMNWTKRYARDMDACEYFLTYADNAAVGYFSKQGFTKYLSMPRDRWHGYIKDYDGGTLMECYIHPTLPFTDIPGMIKAQRGALDSAVQQYTTAHVVHDGITRWQPGREGGMLPIGDVPGVREAGWDETTAASAVPLTRCTVVVDGKLQPLTKASLKQLQLQLLQQLEEEELIWPFKEPVNPQLVPDYYQVVKNPIDISTIRAKIERGGFYITLDIFVADVLRMFANAKLYNAQDTVFYKAAVKLSGLFQSMVNTAVHYEIAE